MATKVLSNEFMQNIATEEAWKELSSNFNWSETTLEKYQDKVDWDEISENRNIRWTIPMIQKFQKKINWDKFSDYADENILSESYLDAFKEKWNWRNLSNNSRKPLEHLFIMLRTDEYTTIEIGIVLTCGITLVSPNVIHSLLNMSAKVLNYCEKQ